ncbi:hypothetical protein PILCRDRAFT_816597 [Piloderma croceum F 1598]|uniref:Uncharacterized protein n=1 Tax=Piloderma croceum (strain F 1598) TaxID=765440 RepID=A0A0C3C8M3_PILCF|nr:hypothetical protein PILCRDRAFT_816597 [Piloderma croceum F 1598]
MFTDKILRRMMKRGQRGRKNISTHLDGPSSSVERKTEVMGASDVPTNNASPIYLLPQIKAMCDAQKPGFYEKA